MSAVDPFCQRVEESKELDLLKERFLFVLELACFAVQRFPADLPVGNLRGDLAIEEVGRGGGDAELRPTSLR